MTMLYTDGFDWYDTFAKGDWLDGNIGGPGVVIAGGRFGSGIYRSDQRGNVYRPLPAVVSSGVLGFAFRTNTIPGNSTLICGLASGGASALSLGIDFLGRICVYTGGYSLLFTDVAGGSVPINAWNYLELKFSLSPSVGTFELRRNGITIGSASGVHTAGGTTADSIVIGEIGVGITVVACGSTVDDLYLVDLNGSVNNDFLGDVRIETLFPTGAGATTNFTRGGTDTGANWSQVNDNPYNDDTTYVTDGTPGDEDLYALADLATVSGTVYTVTTHLRARKDDAGSRSIAALLRSGATEVAGATQGLGTSYVNYRDIWENKPGGSGWTISDVNALQGGERVIS